MIKIKAKINDDDVFDIQYDVQETCALENLAVISYLVNIILEKDDNITEKEIINFIKKRNKYMKEAK